MMTNKGKYRIAHVCLTDGVTQIQEIDDAVVQRYIGGRGLGLYLLRSIPAEKAPLIFMTGPLTDSAVPPGGRYCAVIRSADTGKPVSLSSGSSWGLMLKRACLDGIVIEGEAPAWTYLSIENGTVRLHPADAFLGMRCGETVCGLKSLHGRDSSVLCIGPAGENLVPLSAIMCNTDRAFSRHGIGKIMGAKRLKAIVVGVEDAGGVPDNVCISCPVRCRNMAGEHDKIKASGGENVSGMAEICNEYGLDAVGTLRAIEAVGELQQRGVVKEGPADIREWVRQISRPETELTGLAGKGLAALENVYGKDLLPRSSKAARDGVKQKVTEEMAALIDSMGCCLFAAASFRPEDCARLLSDATGNACPTERMLQSGAEIMHLERSL